MSYPNTQPSPEQQPITPENIGPISVTYKRICVNGTTVMADMQWEDLDWLTPELKTVILAEARKQYVVFGALDVVETRNDTRDRTARIINPS